VRPAQPARTDRSHGRLDRPVGIAARFSSSYVAVWCQMLGLGIAPGVPGAASPDQIRTRPFGVWNWIATMPGVPCGATHSTLTSSSGGLDGLAEPLADPVRVAGDLQAGKGEVVGRRPSSGGPPRGVSHWMKNGSCGSAIRPLTPICFQISSVPSGGAGSRRRTRGRGGSRRRRCRRPRRPSRASRRRGRSGRGRPGRRGLVRGGVVEDLDDLEVGAVGQRQDHVAGAEARVHATVVEAHELRVPLTSRVSGSRARSTARRFVEDPAPAEKPFGSEVRPSVDRRAESAMVEAAHVEGPVAVA
jgi:hypothetical protein